jgi:hypothetical protein
MLSNIHKTLFLFCFLIIGSALGAQVPQTFNNYHLRLDQGNITATNVEVIVMMAMEPSGPNRLGSSNLQINFDPTLLNNPQLSSASLSPAYDLVNVTNPTTGKASFNISLANAGSGMPVSFFPTFQEIGRIQFDIVTAGTASFSWTDNIFDTKETVVYFDDEANLRHPVQLINLENTTFDLDLQSFAASWKNEYENDALLEWVTATEDGTLSFIVERSFDGVSGWEEVGEQVATGNSNYGSAYNFEDLQVSFQMPGTYVYYRLKEKHISGVDSYSDAVSLRRQFPKEKNYLIAYPNPISNEVLNVEFNIQAANQEKIDLLILDLSGRVAFQTSFNVNQARSIQIPAEQFAAGHYTVFVRTNQQSLVQKIVKKP